MITRALLAAIVLSALAVAATIFMSDESGQDKYGVQQLRINIIFFSYLTIIGSAYVLHRKKQNEKIVNGVGKLSFIKLLVGTFALSGISLLVTALLVMVFFGPVAMSLVISSIPLFIPVVMIVSFPIVQSRMRS